MELAGDSYEMKILCVTEQNYLFSFLFFSFLFFSLFPSLLSPFPFEGVVGTAPWKSLCFPSSLFPPGMWRRYHCPGGVPGFDPEGSAQDGGRGAALPFHVRFHPSVICLPTFLRPCGMMDGIPWLPSFPQLEDGSWSALSQPRGPSALLFPVVVVTWEMSSVLLCSLRLGQQPSNLLFPRVAGELHSCGFFACFGCWVFFCIPHLEQNQLS